MPRPYPRRRAPRSADRDFYADSRYLLCVRKAVNKAGYDDCRSELERVFQRVRPAARAAPCRQKSVRRFAASGVTGLSRLSVWWLKLGIMPERIEPGRPEQNGRHERMHKTLKAECASPPQADRVSQQHRFDHFLRRVQPAAATRGAGPDCAGDALHAVAAQLSGQTWRIPPIRSTIRSVAYARQYGYIKWQGEAVFLSETLSNEIVGIVETEEGDAQAYFGPLLLGLIDGVSLKLRNHKPAGTSTVGREGSPPRAPPP